MVHESNGVQDWEIEEACLDPRRRIVGRSWLRGEWRYRLLGRATTSGKYLRVIYTLCIGAEGRKLIRPISAVEMTPSERRTYQTRK
ncbi:TPA: hypothetical protein EYP66_08985 [Candidatus Poribacteria bacterium]|nr:hypothetical protein [Candidatus Poribacteria bacterium]